MRIRSLRLHLLCVTLLCSGPWHVVAQDVSGSRLFGANKIVTLELTMSEKEFQGLQPASSFGFGPPGFGGTGFGPPGGGPPGPDREPESGSTSDTHKNTFGVEFPWARATLKADDVTLTDIGIRYKGNFTYMASAVDVKKSFKLDINRFVEDQKLDGMTMLNLHSGVSDPSLTRETFSYTFFRDSSVPAPRTVFAELTLTVPGKHDSELVGVYTLTEQVNKTFLKQHFGDGTGMLLKPEGLQGGPKYLGDDWKAYEDKFRPDGKVSADQKKRLIQFTKLLSEASDEDFAAGIDSFLDVDAFLRFIATNALLSNLDSYLGFGHNYYLYLVPSSNKFVFIPWDMDLSLATWPAVGTPEQLVELSIHHPHAGDDILIDRLFAHPETKERYLGIVRELCSTTFAKEKLNARLDEIEEQLKEPMAREAAVDKARSADRPGNGPGFGFGGGQFGQSLSSRQFIAIRTESVAAQLAGTKEGFVPKPFAFGFGGPGPAPLGGPRPR